LACCVPPATLRPVRLPPGEDPLPPPSGGRGFARPPARSANRSHAYVQNS
jgi:hypothetical protein